MCTEYNLKGSLVGKLPDYIRSIIRSSWSFSKASMLHGVARDPNFLRALQEEMPPLQTSNSNTGQSSPQGRRQNRGTSHGWMQLTHRAQLGIERAHRNTLWLIASCFGIGTAKHDLCWLSPLQLARIQHRTRRTAVSFWTAIICERSTEPSLYISVTSWYASATETSVAVHHRSIVVRSIDMVIDNGLEHVHWCQNRPRQRRSCRTRQTPSFSRASLRQVNRPSFLLTRTKCDGQTDGNLCIIKPSWSRTQKQSSRSKITTSRTLTKNENVTESIFVGINRNGHLTIKPHQQVHLGINIISSRDLSKCKKKENGKIIHSDLLYAEKLKLEESFKDVSLFSNGTYEIKMMVETEPTVIYLIDSLLDTRAISTLINASFMNLQWNTCIKLQYTPRLRTASKTFRPVTVTILLHVHIGEPCVRAWISTAYNLAVDLL